MSLPLPEPLVKTDLPLSKFIPPRDKDYSLLESWDMGGVAIGDTSEGVNSYQWRMTASNGSFKLSRFGSKERPIIYFAPKTTEVDFTFDQSMRLCFTFVSEGVPKLYWYDTTEMKHVVTDYPDIRNPRVSLDDKRDFNNVGSDIVFSYIRDNLLCCRYQRDRFTKEYVLGTVSEKEILRKIGMCRDNRFRFMTEYLK